jgi:hypothetical protein
VTDNAIALFRDEYALPWIVLDRPSAACTIRWFTDLIARGKTSIEELVELMELPGLPITWPPLTQSQSPPKEPILLGFRLAAPFALRGHREPADRANHAARSRLAFMGLLFAASTNQELSERI